MDKLVNFSYVAHTTAGDSNWVQDNVVILDNSAAGKHVDVTLEKVMVEINCMASANDFAGAFILLVTNTDGTVPTMTGNDSALQSALTTYKDLIWATAFTIANGGEPQTGGPILIEPNTKRKMSYGQKLVLVCLNRNYINTTSETKSELVDWNVWYST